MIRTFIATFCLLIIAQAAQAEDNGEFRFGDRPALRDDAQDAPYGSQDPGRQDPGRQDLGRQDSGRRDPEGGYGHEGAYEGAYNHAPRGELVALGERLFFDPGLSGSGQTACATCHNPAHGWAEPHPVSVSDSGKPGRRNAPTIINVAFAPTLMWDGRFRTLEEQALFPFRRSGEMGADIGEIIERLREDPGYSGQFEATLGEPPTPEGVGRAIAAFERTIVSYDSPFDRFWRDHNHSALNPLERHGYEVFTGKGECVSCHDVPHDHHEQPLLTDFSFHNEGIGFRRGCFKDLGRARITHAARDKGAFRTPSLRNVALTAPYMHDGSLPTLEDVVDFYDAGGRHNPALSPELHPLYLSPDEKEALVAFLYSLTDPNYARNDYPRSSRY
jgi:cytochrome c peroxidase